MQPSWKYAINYETDTMDRGQLVETTYEAMIRLNRLKAEYGVISKELSEAENRRLEDAREMTQTIDDIVSSGDYEAQLRLKPQIDRINMSAYTHWEELKLPMGNKGVRFLRSVWTWATGH